MEVSKPPKVFKPFRGEERKGGEFCDIKQETAAFPICPNHDVIGLILQICGLLPAVGQT